MISLLANSGGKGWSESTAITSKSLEKQWGRTVTSDDSNTVAKTIIITRHVRSHRLRL